MVVQQDIRPSVFVFDEGQDSAHAVAHHAEELIAMPALRVDGSITDQRAISLLGWGGTLVLGSLAWVAIFALFY